MNPDRRQTVLESIRAKCGSLSKRLTERVGRAMGACRSCGTRTRSHVVGSGRQCHTCHESGERVVATDGGTTEWGDPEPRHGPDGEVLWWDCPNPDCSASKNTEAKAAAHCADGDEAVAEAENEAEATESHDTTENEPATDESSSPEPPDEGGESGVNPTTTEEVSVRVPDGVEIVHEDGELLARQEPDPDTGVRTDPAEFARYYDLLMQNAPEGYTPHLLRCEKGEKEPATRFGSWKTERNRLDRDEALEWLREGGNVGIAGIRADEGDDDGVESDPLANMDIDDRDAVPESEVKPSLGACSRSRIGDHRVYFDTEETATVERESDGETLSIEVDGVPNIAPDCGEIRTDTQYVVAPGSHVPVVLSDPDDPDLCDIAGDDRENIGRYTVAHEQPAAEISYEELPTAYRDEYEDNEFIKAERDANAAPVGDLSDYSGGDTAGHARAQSDSGERASGESDSATLSENTSDVYKLSFTDVSGITVGYRGVSPLPNHGHSGNRENYFVWPSGSGPYDHKYEVGYTPLTYLLCEAGERHPEHPNGGLSFAEHYKAWEHAKDEEYIDADDSIPLPAIIHVLAESDETEYDTDSWVWRTVEDGTQVGTSDDDPDGFTEDVRLGCPPGGYNTALDILDEAGVEHGRDPVSGPVEPIPAIPFAMLSRPKDELRRYARKRGFDWPETDEVSDRIGDALRESMRERGYTVIDGPTGGNKTGEAAETVWREVDEEITGGQPVVMFCETKAARDEAHERAEQAGLDVKVLRGHTELCAIARGDYDPENCDDELDGEVIKVSDGVVNGVDATRNGTDYTLTVEYEHPDTGRTETALRHTDEVFAVGDDYTLAEAQEPIYIEGELGSDWFEERVVNRGIAVSTAHSTLKELAAKGYVGHTPEESAAGTGYVEPPCCPGEMKCPTATQWPPDGEWADDDGVPLYDLILATDPFAYVPGLRSHKNVIPDEQSDYTDDLGTSGDPRAVTERVRGMLTAFFGLTDEGPETFEEFVTTTRAWNQQDLVKPSNEHAPPDERVPREAWGGMMDAIHYEPVPDWYFGTSDAHTLAPALAQALFWALFDGDEHAGGRQHGRTSHEPPRLDADAGDDPGWNRTYVSVVIDDENIVRTVRNTPDFGTARSVVGLDAWPEPHLWQRNIHPAMTVERVLDPEERALWRRLERGLTVVQVGDATRPPGRKGENFTKAHADAAVAQLRGEFGDDFQAVGCASDIEDRLCEVLRKYGVENPEETVLHFGEEKSRNDFADEVVGLVYGCIDPGDGYVLNLAAECGLDVEPAMHECPTCGGDGCPGDDNCRDGLKRDRGREFVGEDSEDGAALLASVRENHVAQMAGRFGRSDHLDKSVVFVATDAVPPGFADMTVPGVLWMAHPNQKQRALIEYLREQHPQTTAKDAAEAVGCSKKHAWAVLKTLVEQGKATVRPTAGPDGADVYRWQDGASANGSPFAHVDLTPEDVGDATVTSGVWESYTWEVTIAPDKLTESGMHTTSPVGETAEVVPNGGDPPLDSRS